MPDPIIVSTWSFAARGHDAVWPGLAAGGPSIDAVEACCAVVDAAEDVDSVGYGGLPDASGRVSLDGCIMLAPNRCGSACALRRHLHPVSVARRVMERTEHVMLADHAPLRAQVFGVEYLGTTQVVTLRLADGTLVKARLSSENPARMGEQVGLSLRRERISLFDRGSGRALPCATEAAAVHG
jgi:isoaspartyl peptidase/L-asparaginase-like protein (Ntn-hydrolase superfamily)